MQTNRMIGLDLDGVIRHNNKSLGTGDIPIDWRNREKLIDLNKHNALPSHYYVKDSKDLKFIDGALESLALFYQLDIPCYVFTNQEAIGLGIVSEDDWQLLVEVMDHYIQEAGGCISSWNWCPHFPDEGCDCRKPKPGMFTDFRNKLFRDQFDIDLSQMCFIGDNPSDMEAGHNAGCGLKVHIQLDTADEEFRESEYSDVTATSLKDSVVDVLTWCYG